MVQKFLRLLQTNFVLILICLLFLVTRLYKISEIPLSVYWDEASIGYNAYSVLQTGRDEWGEFMPLHFRAFGEFKLPVYVYSVDGVPLLKVWKNDFEHTKEEFRAPDQLIGTVQTFVKGRALFIDFGQPYRLTKLELVFDPNCIIDGSGKIDVSLNQKNWTNVYEELLDIPGFSRFIPNSEPGKLAYLLAADNARYIRIVHNSENSCLRAGPVTVSARGYGL